MTCFERRRRITLFVYRAKHATVQELADYFNVSRQTISNDLRYVEGVRSQPGPHGGVFILEGYHPYNDTLNPGEVELLVELIEFLSDRGKEVFVVLVYDIIDRYGPVKKW